MLELKQVDKKVASAIQSAHASQIKVWGSQSLPATS